MSRFYMFRIAKMTVIKTLCFFIFVAISLVIINFYFQGNTLVIKSIIIANTLAMGYHLLALLRGFYDNVFPLLKENKNLSNTKWKYLLEMPTFCFYPKGMLYSEKDIEQQKQCWRKYHLLN